MTEPRPHHLVGSPEFVGQTSVRFEWRVADDLGRGRTVNTMSSPPTTRAQNPTPRTAAREEATDPCGPTEATRSSVAVATMVVLGPVLVWGLWYVLWNAANQPTLWLVSRSATTAYRWMFAANTHLTGEHLAVNAGVWIAAAWFATRALKVRPLWLLSVAVVAQFTGIAAHLAVDPRHADWYAGASPAVFAVCTVVAVVTICGAHPARWKAAAWLTVAVVVASQLAELEAQLAGTSTTSGAAHLAGASVAAVAVWFQRRRTRRAPARQ